MWLWYAKFLKQYLHPNKFILALAIFLYLAFVLERETVGSFLELQKKRLPLKKTV
jgi:hypothetical protein